MSSVIAAMSVDVSPLLAPAMLPGMSVCTTATTTGCQAAGGGEKADGGGEVVVDTVGLGPGRRALRAQDCPAVEPDGSTHPQRSDGPWGFVEVPDRRSRRVTEGPIENREDQQRQPVTAVTNPPRTPVSRTYPCHRGSRSRLTEIVNQYLTQMAPPTIRPTTAWPIDSPKSEIRVVSKSDP